MGARVRRGRAIPCRQSGTEAREKTRNGHMKTVEPAAVKAMLKDGRELALLDVREEGTHSAGHPFYAAPLPLSRLELLAGDMVPRRSARIVVFDDATGLAERAAAKLAAMGYTDVAIMAGGVGGCLRLAAEHTTEEGDGGDDPDSAHARGRASGIPCPCPALERDRARTPSSGRHTRRGRPRAACCACVWAARRGSARILRTGTEALHAFPRALRQAATSDRSKSSREQHADSRVRKAGVGHPHRTRSGFGAVKSVTRTSMTPITPTAHLDRVR